VIRPTLFCLVLFSAACGSTAPQPGPGRDAGSDAGQPDGAIADAGGSDAGGTDAGLPDAGAATLTVRLRATTAPFAHADGLSGLTTTHTRAGVRSLELLRSSADKAPQVVLDLGSGAVEVGYDDGDDTVIAKVPAASLATGHFIYARMVQTWSHFQVAATMHQAGAASAGTLDELMVMSNHAQVNGVERTAGHLEYTFTGGSGTSSGGAENAPVPVFSTTAGAWAVVENGDWAVYYPVSLDLSPFATDRELVITVNMDHAFRWTDNALGVGYLPGVFDIEPPYYEPVVRFGGNAFDATIP
jgi:hypothetical protein